MGQRLNIEIKKNSKRLANAYYHWSGYYISSLVYARDIAEAYHIGGLSTDPVELAVELLYATGAGISSDELDYAQAVLPRVKLSNSRNDGLIGISEIAMDATEKYEEARLTIDLDDFICSTDCVYTIDENDMSKEELEALPVFPFDDIHEMPLNVDDINARIHFSNNHDYFKIGDEYYGFLN